MVCDVMVLVAVDWVEVVLFGEYGCYGLGYIVLGVDVFEEVFVSIVRLESV